MKRLRIDSQSTLRATVKVKARRKSKGGCEMPGLLSETAVMKDKVRKSQRPGFCTAFRPGHREGGPTREERGPEYLRVFVRNRFGERAYTLT